MPNMNIPGQSRGGASSGGAPPTGSTPARGGAQGRSDPVEQAAEKAQSAFENTKHRVSEQITSVVRAIERAGDQLRQSDQRGLARRVEQFTRKAESATRYLEDKTPQDLKNDLDDLARRKPAWFLGGAFVAGILGARFLKSSEKSSARGRATSAGRALGRRGESELKGEPAYATP